MFVIHVFDKVLLASEDTASRIATIVPSMFSNPEDFSFAVRLIVLIKRLSGIKIATSRAADLYGVTSTSFSVSSLLSALVWLLFVNVARFRILIEILILNFFSLTLLSKTFAARLLLRLFYQISCSTALVAKSLDNLLRSSWLNYLHLFLGV